MQSLARLLVIVWLSGVAVLPAQAAFSSLYAFGDGVCTTTENIYGGASYYPYTYSNGRIWIQVLAQRLGLTYEATKNNSYMWHNSGILVTNASQFSAADAGTSLFVIWVSDADFVDDMSYIYPSLNLTAWNNAISASIANHQTAIQTFYSKGVRTLIAPNAVDIAKIPQYAGLTTSEKTFIRGRVIYFNTSFVTMLNQVKATRPDLTIYVPDFFSLLDDMVVQAGNYGFTNVTGYATFDGYHDLAGPRAGWLWWDVWDPTAKAHEIMADTAKQMIAPVRISKVTSVNGSNRLDVVNVPVGLSGYVDARTTPGTGTWTQAASFNSISAAQAIYVAATGPRQFYRLRFPFAWSSP